MTPKEFNELLNKPVIRKRNPDCGQASSAEPQQIACTEPMEASGRKESNAGRSVVRITSFRRRLLDKDNLYGGVKFFVDSLRYAQLIPNDSVTDIELEVVQEKVQSEEEERTEILITRKDSQ